MSTPASANLDDRYGVKPPRRFPWGKTIVITVFALGVVFIGFLTLTGRDSAPTSKDLAFDVVNAARTNVSLSVVPDKSRTVYCAVQALNGEHGVVGYTEVSVPADPDRNANNPVVLHEKLRTTQLAVNGGIDKCWFADSSS